MNRARPRLPRRMFPRPPTLRKFIRLAETLPTRGNEREVYIDIDRLYDRMIADIDAATIRVNFEIYTILSDRVGERFAESLARRAEAGVEVRLLYDSLGCLSTSRSFFARLRERGVHVTEYHPIAPWRRAFAIFGRNHRKTLIVDGKIAYTGGVNIGLTFASKASGGAGWRDTHIRLEGPAASDLESLFAESWFYKTGENLDYDHPREPLPGKGDYPSAWTEQIYVIGNRGLLSRPLRRIFLLAFGTARRRIEVTCPYLVPDRKLKRALLQAAQRGVKVRLLVPGRSDVRVVDYASRYHFRDYLNAGIEIFLWQPTILHAKVCTVDDRFTSIGSNNLDSHSLNYNLEAMVACDDPHLTDELRAQFDQDRTQAIALTAEDWRHRSWTTRVIEWLAMLLSPIL